MKRSILGMSLLLLLSACQVFRGADAQATLQAENIGYVAEATAIAQTGQGRSTQVMATAQAASTYVAEVEHINQQLVVTVRAGDPPTVERVVDSAPGAVGTPSAVTGLQFVELRTASQVRESDGCADGFQSEFFPDSERIYITTRAFNIGGGTRMDVEWSYEGQVVWEDSWTVPGDSTDFCLWFFIDPTQVSFSPGNWSVRLYADGVAVEPAATFTIAGAMVDEGG